MSKFTRFKFKENFSQRMNVKLEQVNASCRLLFYPNVDTKVFKKKYFMVPQYSKLWNLVACILFSPTPYFNKKIKNH